MRGAVSEMPIVHIEPPTKEEIERYKRAKNEEFLKSFSDKENYSPMSRQRKGAILELIQLWRLQRNLVLW